MRSQYIISQIKYTLLISCVGFFSNALALVEIPNLSGPVIDQAKLLNSNQQEELAVNLRLAFDRGGPQMQFWSLPSLEGEDVAALAIRAAEKWKLGREKKDDGALLIIALAERKTRLEVGRGLEGAVPDVVAARLLRNVLRPALQKNEIFAGVTAVFEQVQVLMGPEGEEAARHLLQESSEKGKFPYASLLIIGFFAFLVLVRMGNAKALLGRGASGWSAGGGLGHRGGSWGGGGSSWGGGGGGFSGGGSSGDW